MSKLTLLTHKTNRQIAKSEKCLEAGKAILKSFTEPKKKFVAFDYKLIGTTFHVEYADQFGEEYDKDFTVREILDFIENYYSNVIDRCVNGEHDQYIVGQEYGFVDGTSSAIYFEENLYEVLTDKLNN